MSAPIPTWRIMLLAPLWVWDRPARRDAITVLMWAVPMGLRGRWYLSFARWLMRRWHKPHSGVCSTCDTTTTGDR